MSRKGIIKGCRDDLEAGLFFFRLLLRRLLFQLFYCTAKVGTTERRLRSDPIRGALPQLPLGFRVWNASAMAIFLSSQSPSGNALPVSGALACNGSAYMSNSSAYLKSTRPVVLS